MNTKKISLILLGIAGWMFVIAFMLYNKNVTAEENKMISEVEGYLTEYNFVDDCDVSGNIIIFYVNDNWNKMTDTQKELTYIQANKDLNKIYHTFNSKKNVDLIGKIRTSPIKRKTVIETDIGGNIIIY